MSMNFIQYLLEYCGESELEESNPNVPANHDRVQIYRNEPKEYGKSKPSVKRQGQRGGRGLRRLSGRGNPSKNAMDYYTPNELNRGEEETETKLPAKRDRQMAINKWIQDTDKPIPLSRIKTQENRIKRRLYGK